MSRSVRNGRSRGWLPADKPRKLGATLWTIVSSSLRQRLTPPDMLGRIGSTNLFIAAGGNCAGAVLGGLVASRFGITAPYWAGFALAIAVSATTWRVFSRATMEAALASPDHHDTDELRLSA